MGPRGTASGSEKQGAGEVGVVSVMGTESQRFKRGGWRDRETRGR